MLHPIGFIESKIHDVPVDGWPAYTLACIPVISTIFITIKNNQLESEFNLIAQSFPNNQSEAKFINLISFNGYRNPLIMPSQETMNQYSLSVDQCQNVQSYVDRFNNVYKFSQNYQSAFFQMQIPAILVLSIALPIFKMYVSMSTLIGISALAIAYSFSLLHYTFSLSSRSANFYFTQSHKLVNLQR